MIFTYDTNVALQAAAALINTDSKDGDLLASRADLDRFVADQQWSGGRTHDDAELASTRALRGVLRQFWELDEVRAVELVNDLLVQGNALPRLVRHDHWDWHLHATPDDAPLATRMSVEMAMAMVDVIRAKELSRLRVCAADDCESVFVDLSKNRSKRYCDFGNCGNRANVAAYRARRARAASR